ncbi:DsrE family protein [Kaarinaea lacus]
MKKLVGASLVMFFLSTPAFADNDCPADVLTKVETDFGPGSADATRCLENTGERRKVKVVYQINQECKNSQCTAPYAFGNIKNAIKDYQAHGMENGVNYEIVAIVHSAGWKLILNDSRNNYLDEITDFINTSGVKVYFCQNTARSKGVQFADMIPGVEFTTSGVTALADFQLEGYMMVQP